MERRKRRLEQRDKEEEKKKTETKRKKKSCGYEQGKPGNNRKKNPHKTELTQPSESGNTRNVKYRIVTCGEHLLPLPNTHTHMDTHEQQAKRWSKS